MTQSLVSWRSGLAYKRDRNGEQNLQKACQEGFFLKQKTNNVWGRQEWGARGRYRTFACCFHGDSKSGNNRSKGTVSISLSKVGCLWAFNGEMAGSCRKWGWKVRLETDSIGSGGTHHKFSAGERHHLSHSLGREPWEPYEGAFERKSMTAYGTR